LLTKDGKFDIVVFDNGENYELIVSPTDERDVPFVLDYFATKDQAERIVPHFVACYNIAIEEGFALDWKEEWGGPYFRNPIAGEANVYVDDALVPDEQSAEQFGVFLRGVLGIPKQVQ
jgi:hypothetical protein